ncbi:hypothetical protein CEXT_344101 [Caerostris extrusa]|uniref:Secreted protein n=1 Tax=Caerostris extrusa TaxID=172846 RepID=A0AAV4Y6Q4_CAEEX|nr:hypothetical protein CEXT_344101 [Caerostris extrusa]
MLFPLLLLLIKGECQQNLYVEDFHLTFLVSIGGIIDQHSVLAEKGHVNKFSTKVKRNLNLNPETSTNLVSVANGLRSSVRH